MAAVINNEYVLRYLKWYDGLSQDLKDSNKGALDLMRNLAELTGDSRFLAGKPKYGDNRDLLLLYGFPEDIPGIDLTTWCILYVHILCFRYNLAVELIEDEKIDVAARIWYTTGNEMAAECEKEADRGTVKEVPGLMAQGYADRGHPVVIAARGLNGNAGHVAILAPSMELYHPIKGDHEYWVAQAGGWNGFFPLKKAFPRGITETPRFYLLPGRK